MHIMSRLFQPEGPGDESQWDSDQRQDPEVSQFHFFFLRIQLIYINLFHHIQYIHERTH